MTTLRHRIFDNLLLLTTLACGFTITWYAHSVSTAARVQREEERQYAIRQAISDGFSLDLVRLIETMRAAGLMVSTHKAIDRNSFVTYAENALLETPALISLNWIPVVSQADLASFEAAARKEGLADYQVVEPSTDGFLPVRSRSAYLPILYSFPQDSAKAGFDNAIVASRLNAMQAARANGQPTATALIKPMIGDRKDAMIGILTPVFSSLAVADTKVPTRRGEAQVRGYVAGVLLLEALFNDAAFRANSQDIDFVVLDRTDGLPVPIFSRLERPDSISELLHDDSALQKGYIRISLDVASRPWEIVLRPRARYFERQQDSLARILLVVGCAVTFLLAFLLLRLQRSWRHLRAAEAAAQKARMAAESASQAKSSFLTTMSHEIRTPMNGILGMLRLLQHTELTSRQIDYTRKAEGATQALLGIINDILDFSKVEAGRLELDVQAFVIGDLLRDLAVILSVSLGSKNVEVLFDLATDVPPVLVGDSLRLRQVLINLTGNALKFTEQGEVLMGIHLLRRDADRVELEFSVRDTGIGIPADKIGYIFEGFSQAESSTSRRFGGTGLGLAISQRMVALMGGILAVESEFGKGSRFFFSISLGIGQALGAGNLNPHPRQDGSSLMQALHVPGGVGLRVLIVDDNALSREILEEMSIAKGWHVECAVSGEAALAHLENADTPNYDIVLMDWRMPGMDGWETTRKIRQIKNGEQAPVIIMVTAAARELLSKKSMLETNLFDGYLIKPITASMLYETVAEAIVEHKDEHIRHSFTHTSAQLAELRLLVVEDNTLNQQIAKELLERCGAHITIAGSGLEGVERALAADPTFDAILMDVQMPDIDGLEATRRVRAVPRMRGVPIIAMTANAMEADKKDCLDAGMVDHVSKPIDLDALITTVLRHAGRSTTIAAVPALTFETFSQPVPNVATHSPAMEASFIDVDAAVKRMGDNREFYDKVARGFRNDGAVLVAELQRYITMKDHAEAKRAAHTLRGLAATIGAVALSALAEQIETTMQKMLADTGAVDATRLAEFSTSLGTHLAQVVAALPQPLSPSASGPSEHEGVTLLDRETFAAKLLELWESLQLRDMRAIKLGEQLRQQFGSMLDTDQLEQLSTVEHALGRLDFARAIDACDALRSGFF